MTSPFSDLTRHPEPLPHEWDQAERLARRLGLQPQMHPGKWQNLLFAAVHRILDRLDQEAAAAGHDAREPLG